MAERDPHTGRFLPGNQAAKGHGRPSRPVELEILETFNATVSKSDWIDIIKVAVKLAKRGDYRAREWLADRVIGKPLQQIDIHAIAEAPDDVINVTEMIEDGQIDVE